jgi:hypothetical protein
MNYILKLGVMFALAASVYAASADTILDRPDVVKSIAQARHDSFGPPHIEYALLVRKDSVDFVAGSGDNVQFTWDPTIITVIHTHPDAGFEQPSPQDLQMAIKFQQPMYVVSRTEIWVALPTGIVYCASCRQK